MRATLVTWSGRVYRYPSFRDISLCILASLEMSPYVQQGPSSRDRDVRYKAGQRLCGCVQASAASGEHLEDTLRRCPCPVSPQVLPSDPS